MLDALVGAGYTDGSSDGGVTSAKVAVSARFRTGILTTTVDDFLPGVAGTRTDGRYVGSIRVEATVAMVNVNVEGLIELENYLEGAPQTTPEKVLLPAMDVNTGLQISTFVMLVRLANDPDCPPHPVASLCTAPLSTA